MSCYDEDEDAGTIAEDSHYDWYTWTSEGDCSTSITQDYEIEMAVSTRDHPDVNFDQITDYKRWFLNSYFSNKPGNLVSDSCQPEDGSCFDPDCEETQPIKVEYWAGHYENEDEDYWYPRSPRPRDQESDSKYFGFALALLSDWAGSTAAYIADYVANSLGRDDVIVEENDLNSTGTKQEIYWDIYMNNGNADGDHPSSKCDTTGVSVVVDDNRDNSGVTSQVPVRVRYEFSYVGYEDDQTCPVECARPYGERYIKATDKFQIDAEYESV